MLSIEELAELEEQLIAAIPDRITEALTIANRNGEIDELLRLLRMQDLIGADNWFQSYRKGKIVVCGGTEVKEEVLLSVGAGLGIDKSRFEFCLEYEKLQKYDFKKLQYAPQYRVILFGPMPHSGYEKKDSSSVITELETKEAYPRVERLLNGSELKITKTNFKKKLKKLINENYI